MKAVSKGCRAALPTRLQVRLEGNMILQSIARKAVRKGFRAEAAGEASGGHCL